ncbi:hypothetical protein [Pelagibacterium halotolerans]|uniref:hypothetical protein n=1 Tax=Pelagibacterium halotolerans TaxID=531813 RepID=UPI00384E6551
MTLTLTHDYPTIIFGSGRLPPADDSRRGEVPVLRIQITLFDVFGAMAMRAPSLPSEPAEREMADAKPFLFSIENA